jgi:hypothetical protein
MSLIRSKNQGAARMGDKEIEEIKVIVEFCSMSQETKDICISKTKEAMRYIGDGNLNYFKKLAKKIKHDLEQDKDETWNVIVGTDYGAYLAFEKAYLIYFRLNELYFLIFRFGA